MPVYFRTPGLIDLDTIRLQGVSVKVNENPIGYFGTGLKFAIATLLRFGCTVKLHRHDGPKLTTLEFTVRPTLIRGQPFSRVYMGDEGLSFTTDLGKNWQVWQAYRELYSNTLDEEGKIETSLPAIPAEQETIFEVGGEVFLTAHERRGEIFLTGEPLWECSAFQVFDKVSQYIFYRGVRAGRMPDVSPFTYNILQAAELTEDRTLKNVYEVYTALGRRLPATDVQAIINYITASPVSWDQKLDFDWADETSELMIAAVENSKHKSDINNSILQRVNRLKPKVPDHERYQLIELNDRQRRQVEAAFVILKNLNCALAANEVKYVESLGTDVLGLYSRTNNQIYISLRCLDMGTNMIAATFYEEWLHKHEGLEDCSRGLQDYLLQRLIAAYS